MKKHPFELFLSEFVPELSLKVKQSNKILWILETTGSSDAADLKADLDTEIRILFNNPSTYQQLLVWDKDLTLSDPLLKRELDLLIRDFKQNQISKELLEQLSQKEAGISMSYAIFRPEFEGKRINENEIRDILKKEKNPTRRKAVWEVSKENGEVLAPQILHLVELRNQSAKDLGYSDYFQMQLDLQEVDSAWLMKTLDELVLKSEKAHANLIHKIEEVQSQYFEVPKTALGPWAWTDPFGQEDPLNTETLDRLVSGVDVVKASVQFYQNMGIDVSGILAKSDMYGRPNKNQHAFCINIDKEEDVRTLNNVTESIRWLETVLHEFGHGIYELGINRDLPWLLRVPPHMITTEAMALLAGRQAYRYDSLGSLVGSHPDLEALRKEATESLNRRQLIFSRWVLVMTLFEQELYRDPKQNLNALWWALVEKYQKIKKPENRDNKWDWATKYHIGLAPVYYFSYLLGEMFASSIQEALVKESGSAVLASKSSGKFLQEKLFYPGARMNWNDLVKHVTGKPLTSDAWIREFAQ